MALRTDLQDTYRIRELMAALLADTLSLLDGARSLGFVERIDWAFRALAFEDMLNRPPLELHLTPEPETFGTPCAPRFAGLMARANRELTIAAEIYAEAFEPDVALDRGLAEIREWGWKVVLADVADDDRALAGASAIEPDMVQIDLRLAGRRNGDEHHGVRRLLEIAGEQGAAIMALGIDTPSALEPPRRSAPALAAATWLATQARFRKPDIHRLGPRG